MKKFIFLSLVVILTLSHGLCLAKAKTPKEVAGLVLGSDIELYKDRLRMDTAIPIRHREYLHEVELKETKGLKSGLIIYGTCSTPNPVLRIMLKYENGSKKFYTKLLELYKKRFGEPDEWKGDAFGIVQAWKWSFVDKNKNRIGLILQHNTQDPESRIGNSVKFTYSSLLEKEHECFRNKNKGNEAEQEKPTGKKDLEFLIPK